MITLVLSTVPSTQIEKYRTYVLSSNQMITTLWNWCHHVLSSSGSITILMFSYQTIMRGGQYLLIFSENMTRSCWPWFLLMSLCQIIPQQHSMSRKLINLAAKWYFPRSDICNTHKQFFCCSILFRKDLWWLIHFDWAKIVLYFTRCWNRITEVYLLYNFRGDSSILLWVHTSTSYKNLKYSCTDLCT